MRSKRLRILITAVFMGMSLVSMPMGVGATHPPQRDATVRSVAPRGQISASVAYAMPGRGGSQIVHVRVTDVSGRGVSGAPVRIVVHDGATGVGPNARIYGTMTDATGYAWVRFPIGQVSPGFTALVRVTAQVDGQVLQTYTRYTPCY